MRSNIFRAGKRGLSLTMAIALILACAVCLIAPTAMAAETYSPRTVCGPLSISGGTATNVTATLDIRKNKDTAIQFSFTGNAAGVSNVVVWLTPSVDGSKWDSANTILLSVAANGTTEVVRATNIAQSVWGGYGYVKVVATNSADGNAVTNFYLKQSIKY